jgi:hypothetical protein
MARATRDEWQRRVARWRDSGLTAKEFAAREGLKTATLSFWRWKLSASPGGASGSAKGSTRRRKRRRQAGSGVRGSKASFVGFELVASSTSGSELEVLLDAGLRIRIPSGFDEPTLQRLVSALRGTDR